MTTVMTLSCMCHRLLSQLSQRMDLMCQFANEEQTGAFLHPFLKAIILHFWLAYDHPFIDGNGRTARALFYWSVLSQGFWLFEFVSISSIIHKAPIRYARSFLYTETDENDLTYFILFQLTVMRRESKSCMPTWKEKREKSRTLKDCSDRRRSIIGRSLSLGMRSVTQAWSIPSSPTEAATESAIRPPEPTCWISLRNGS